MSKKTKICLNAMVGNEANTITRMLESTAPHIDYWVIQCNGQEDNTREIIENFFKEKNIPGFAYETEWNYPGFNRDHTLQECLKADHGCDWILRMDADERLHVDEDFDWSILDDTSIQSYNICAQANDVKYFRTWFWNAKLPWFFQHDKRHETIHLPELGEAFQRINMPISFRHLVSQDGETWAAPRKFLKDALELEIDKVVGDKVMEDFYHLWYIAKSYADCYGNPKELPFGKKHSDEYARRAIWYFERFLEVTQDWEEGKKPKYSDEMAYFSFVTMAFAYNFLGEHDKAEKYFNYATDSTPSRNEHYFHLLFFYEGLKKYDKVIETLDLMMKPERKNPFPTLSFLIEDRAYVDTSNFLNEYREKILKKINEPMIDLNSVNFDFK